MLLESEPRRSPSAVSALVFTMVRLAILVLPELIVPVCLSWSLPAVADHPCLLTVVLYRDVTADHPCLLAMVLPRDVTAGLHGPSPKT